MKLGAFEPYGLLVAELYRQALDQLVVLQREAARAPQRAGCFQIAFDFEKLSWEMHFF